MWCGVGGEKLGTVLFSNWMVYSSVSPTFYTHRATSLCVPLVDYTYHTFWIWLLIAVIALVALTERLTPNFGIVQFSLLSLWAVGFVVSIPVWDTYTEVETQCQAVHPTLIRTSWLNLVLFSYGFVVAIGAVVVWWIYRSLYPPPPPFRPMRYRAAAGGAAGGGGGGGHSHAPAAHGHSHNGVACHGH